MKINDRVQNVMASDILVAQIFKLDASGPVIFPTPDELEMQCGFGEVPEDRYLKAHVHNIVERQTQNTSEFIYVISGKIDIVFLDPEGDEVGVAVISPGHGVLQYVGGHQITIRAGTRYFELKQGPYFGHVKDKTVL